MDYKNLEAFNPSVCISGKIMRVSRVTASIFRKYLQAFGVTNSQTTILFILSKKGGLTQKELSDIAVLEKSTLNRNLKRLYDKEYLTRKDFPVIKITPEGKRFVNSIIPEWKKAMSEIKEILQTEGEQALDLLHEKLI